MLREQDAGVSVGEFVAMAGLTQDEESNRIIILGSLPAVAIHDAKGRNERRSVTAVKQTYTQVRSNQPSPKPFYQT